ncbi:MAG: ribonuclease PH [Myxococcales bacterium]|nr:ribonuclease PH [Myxococcales bacterium]MCB9534377.1 ribonuclease PH [Myxococcales bacterium]
MRHDGRAATETRRIELQPGFTTNPDGSVLVRFGRTMVLCTAKVEPGVPRFRKDLGGWLTAEYQMVPGSTNERSPREAVKGGQKGRTHEIQRLIGRSIRAAIDLDAFSDHTIHLDCEVLQADGGTRTASITGAYVALALAVDRKVQAGAFARSPLTGTVAAISLGVVSGEVVVDLDYVEDSSAAVDANLVMTGAGEIVEVQATGEHGTLSRAQLSAMLDLGGTALAGIRGQQLEALGPAAHRLGLAR